MTQSFLMRCLGCAISAGSDTSMGKGIGMRGYTAEAPSFEVCALGPRISGLCFQIMPIDGRRDLSRVYPSTHHRPYDIYVP